MTWVVHRHRARRYGVERHPLTNRIWLVSIGRFVFVNEPQYWRRT